MNIKVKDVIVEKASAEQIFHAILKIRGYKTKAEQTAFLHPADPTLEYILKESLIKKSTLSKAQKLLDSHLKNNHDICIFGDYDADGVTATAIMWQAVTAYAKVVGSKSRVLPFIPDRHKHGYGLSEQAVGDVLSGDAFRATQSQDFKPSLVITVDTGIVAHVGIKSFRDAGIEVIITDHHLPAGATRPALQAGQPETDLPPANAVVHTLATSGAGVAWIVALYLLGAPANKLIDLATIGIVADMMPLTGINRSICTLGLKSLSLANRPGLLAMKNTMGIGSKSLTTYDISFGIAPRINAAGRIYNPIDALRLLCTSDPKLAGELSTKIESHNKDRQDYTDRALKLSASKNTDHKIIVVIGDYHEGVIGLVAGKLTEMFNRPSIVMSDNGEVIKGSARSIAGVNITTLLRSLKVPFLGLGGHEQAAGFSIAKEYVTQLTQELEQLGDVSISDNQLIKQYSADLQITLSTTSLSLAKLLHDLEPFGMGNPKPKFVINDLIVLEDRKLGSEGKHRKLLVEQGGITRDLLLFNTKEKFPLTTIKSVIATFDVNVWRDKESLQLIASYVQT